MSSHNDTPSLVFYPEQGKLSRKLYSHTAIFSGKNKVTPSHGIFLHRGTKAPMMVSGAKNFHFRAVDKGAQR